MFGLAFAYIERHAVVEVEPRPCASPLVGLLLLEGSADETENDHADKDS